VTASTQDHARIRAAALAAERRNRPFGWIAGAAALLILSAVFAGWSVARAAGARADVSRAQFQLTRAESITDEIRAIRTDPQRAAQNRIYQPEPRFRTKVNQVSQELELGRTPRIQDRPLRVLGGDRNAPLEKRTYEVSIDRIELEKALRWIGEVRRRIPGLHVSAIEIRPRRGTTQWDLRVNLSRWRFRQ